MGTIAYLRGNSTASMCLRPKDTVSPTYLRVASSCELRTTTRIGLFLSHKKEKDHWEPRTSVANGSNTYFFNHFFGLLVRSFILWPVMWLINVRNAQSYLPYLLVLIWFIYFPLSIYSQLRTTRTQNTKGRQISETDLWPFGHFQIWKIRKIRIFIYAVEASRSSSFAFAVALFR